MEQRGLRNIRRAGRAGLCLSGGHRSGRWSGCRSRDEGAGNCGDGADSRVVDNGVGDDGGGVSRARGDSGGASNHGGLDRGEDGDGGQGVVGCRSRIGQAGKSRSDGGKSCNSDDSVLHFVEEIWFEFVLMVVVTEIL